MQDASCHEWLPKGTPPGGVGTPEAARREAGRARNISRIWSQRWKLANYCGCLFQRWTKSPRCLEKPLCLLPQRWHEQHSIVQAFLSLSLLYIYIYIYVSTYTHVYTYTHIHIPIHIHMHMHIHIHIHIHIHNIHMIGVCSVLYWNIWFMIRSHQNWRLSSITIWLMGRNLSDIIINDWYSY